MIEQLVPLKPGFKEPATDLSVLLEAIGTKLYSRERTVAQFIAWAVEFGVFEAIHDMAAASTTHVAEKTQLTEAGADAVLGVLCALGLLARTPVGLYSLQAAAKDYLLVGSPYYIGAHLNPPGLPIPDRYLRKEPNLWDRFRLRLLRMTPIFRHGSLERLLNQHVRNLSACVAAVQTSAFNHIHSIVDVGGGSGTLAIPLALKYPDLRITIADLPLATRNVEAIIAKHGLTQRLNTRAFDAFASPWRLPECDAFFFGNFLHGFGDEACVWLCRQAFSSLPAGGRILVHEMLWNDTRDGPLTTAVWHAAMRSAGGRQRTSKELLDVLLRAGFLDFEVVPTATPFALVCGRKPGGVP